MQLKNIQNLNKEEDLISFCCGEDENNLETVYMDKNAKVIMEFDEKETSARGYKRYGDSYLFVIDYGKEDCARLIKLDAELKQSVLYEAEDIIIRDNGCIVYKNGYGYIDFDGKEIIKPQYEHLLDTDYDLFIISNGEKNAVINKDGTTVLPFKYDNISEIGKYTDSQGKCVLGFVVGNIYEDENAKLQLNLDIAEESNSKISNKIKEYKYGLVNEKDETIIPIEYDYIGMSETPTGIFAAEKETSKGMIDINNNVVIPFEYRYIIPEEDGMFTIHKKIEINGLRSRLVSGIVDSNGKILIPCEDKYLIMQYINKNLIIVLKEKGKYVLLNYKNEKLSDIYDEIQEDDNDANLFLVKKDNKLGFINRQGKVAIPLKYDKATEFRGGLAIADNTVINENGEVLYEADKDTNIINLEVGIIAVERKDKVFDLIKLI